MIYEIKNLSFSYGQHRVFQNVNIEIKKGEVVTLLGPNGSGKTTLLKTMIHLLEPTEGTIQLEGQMLQQMKRREIARRVGYVPQIHVPVFDYQVLDVILMGGVARLGVFQTPSKREKDRAEELLEEMHLSHLASRSYMEISGGERQQVMIARAMFQEPQVILLDEPTAYLDYGNQFRMLERVQKMTEKGYAVVLTTHNPDHGLLMGGKVAVMSQSGTLTSGTVDEMITEKKMSELYGIPIRFVDSKEVGRTICTLPAIH